MEKDVKRTFERVLLLAALAFCGAALAATVTADQAKTAVQRWLRDDPALGCPIQGAVGDVRTCTPTNGASFHVVKLAAGGFVVTSADTRRAPVVAFSSGADLVEDDANPLWVLLKRDLAIRTQGESSGGGAQLMGAAPSEVEAANEAKWAKLLGGGAQLMSMQGISSVSDVRVAPLVQSKWNQENVGSDYCYNYYTPNHYVCGCVATAGAQIMRYFCFPTAAMSPYTNEYCAVNGTPTTLITQGGTYDWGQMPLVPDSSMTVAQRQAIGKLTSDVGICCNMDYASDGSSSGGFMLADAFTNHFGYASAQVANWKTDHSLSADVKKALLSNFDAGLPVALGLDGRDGGHEIVGDGYGYSDGTLYIHFNMGWEGFDDAWYAPPAMGTTQYDFSIVDGVVYNVFTNLPLNTVICSGRVLDANGVPVENAIVSYYEQGSLGGGSGIQSANNTGYVYTDQKGIYALILTPGSYTISAWADNGPSASVAVTLSANVSIEYAPGGGYWTLPEPQVNNVCEKDIVLTGLESVAEPQFTPSSCLFYPSTNVVISCATAGATIRYTLDGSDPIESSTLYTGAITVSDNVTIKARAWKNGMNPSVIVTATYTYDAAQGAPKGDYFADPIAITGANGSQRIDDNAPYTVEPGEPWHTLNGGSHYNQSHTIWYEWTAPGSGTIKFTTEMPRYYGGTFLAVYTGNTLSSLQRLGFSTDWDTSDGYRTSVSIAVTQGSTYRIVGMSCDESATDAFVLTWSGDLTVVSTETSTTEVPVPYTWLDTYFAGQGTSAQAYETLANADQDGDGFTTWQEYLAGTDPTSAASCLQVSIRMEGTTPILEWNVTNSNVQALGYRYVPKGKVNLTDSGAWQPSAANHRFFKLFIEPAQ
ncbi:MAG: C10 family peptidase [Kiritimatiellae bacterium]|nr:C10 family peptidase [Kiritimatiellia bacterium]